MVDARLLHAALARRPRRRRGCGGGGDASAAEGDDRDGAPAGSPGRADSGRTGRSTSTPASTGRSPSSRPTPASGQVRRGHQRQPGVLGEAAAAARRGRLGRPQPDHRERLARGPDVRPRLSAAARPRGAPNVEENLLPALRHPAADPDREFTVPWQSGMTGIDRPHRPRARHRLGLRPLRPQVQGPRDDADRDARHGADDAEEHGHRPREATTDEWLAAVDKIEAAADSGQIRKFTGNDYIRELASGNAWASLGWSGDAVQLQKDNPNIEFVMPEEGCMLWSTSLEIPVGAPNPAGGAGADQLRLRPAGAGRHRRVGQLRDARSTGSSGSSAKRDPELARNQLIFPSKKLHAELHLRAGARRRAWATDHRSLPAA